MAGGGFAQLPDGSVIVALSLPRPTAAHGATARPQPGGRSPGGPRPAVAEARTPAAVPAAYGSPGAAGTPGTPSTRTGGPHPTSSVHPGAVPPGGPSGLRRGAPGAGRQEPEPRRWSAHADEPHTVRAASRTVTGGGAAPVGADGREEPRVRVLVHAANRARALTRLRNLGLRAVYLRGNAEPPTPDEITAVLHHPEGLLWRASPGDDTESWHPIAALLRHRQRSRRTA